MPGLLFHAEEAISYFSKYKDAVEAEKKSIYAIFPDIQWMLIDGMGYDKTHDMGAIHRMRNYIDSSDGCDPWLYLMMGHHLAIDNITDDKQDGYLNEYETNIADKLSRFSLPHIASDIVMDVALDLAQYEHSISSGRDITDILMKSKESIDAGKIGDVLAYSYDGDRQLYTHFGEEIINFDLSELRTAEGVLATFRRYYDSKDTNLKIKLRIGEGKIKNWFKKKALKRFLNNKRLQDNMRSVINEEKEIFKGKIDEIHDYILQHTPSLDKLI